MGCYLDFGGTVWLPQQMSMAMSDNTVGGLTASDDGRLMLDWPANELRAYTMNTYGVDPAPIYKEAKEAIPEDGMDYVLFCDQVTASVAEAAGTDADTLAQAYLAYLQEVAEDLDARRVRGEGEPIRILILDSSETIMGTEITTQMLSDPETSEADDIVKRAETIYKGVSC